MFWKEIVEVLIPWIKSLLIGCCYWAFLSPYLEVPVEIWELSGMQKGRSRPVKCPNHHFSHLNTPVEESKLVGTLLGANSIVLKLAGTWLQTHIVKHSEICKLLLNFSSLKSATMGVFCTMVIGKHWKKISLTLTPPGSQFTNTPLVASDRKPTHTSLSKNGYLLVITRKWGGVGNCL